MVIDSQRQITKRFYVFLRSYERENLNLHVQIILDIRVHRSKILLYFSRLVITLIKIQIL